MLPAQARAVVNFRLLDGDTIAKVEARSREIIADTRVKIEPLALQMEPSRISSSDSDSFKLLHRTIRQVVPDSIVAPFLVIAATDARHYGKLTDNVYRFVPITIGPEDIKRIHIRNGQQ